MLNLIDWLIIGCLDVCIKRARSGEMERWTDGRKDERIEEWTEGGMNTRVVGRTDECILETDDGLPEYWEADSFYIKDV